MMAHKPGIGDEVVSRLIAAYPRVLRRGVIDALRKVEAAAQIMGVSDDAFEWLRLYREGHQVRMVPWYGLNIGLSPHVEKLDEALKALRDYKEKDYITADARKANRRQTGLLGGREPSVFDATISNWLRDQGYENAENKKAILLAAEDHFGVKKTKVMGAAKVGGLTKQKRKPLCK